MPKNLDSNVVSLGEACKKAVASLRITEPRKWCSCGFDGYTNVVSCPWCGNGLVDLSPLLF